MNVFEDLIIELKEENLLESTVMDQSPVRDTDEIVQKYNNYDLPGFGGDTAAKLSFHAVGPPVPSADEQLANGYELQPPEHTETRKEPAQGKRQPRSKEFFKKRAVGEVSSLQMVEHVLTGVEREYMKIVPKAFDDFTAKKALHTFLQLEDSVNSEKHAAAEFTLMQETEAWCSALAERDRNVQVSSLRQYCENSRPALSSQALLGLARFYRNLPCSESVRSKFDFVITRLFSRAISIEKRVCLFTRDEILTHINTLYSEWSSISLYDGDEDQANVMLTAMSFEDLSVEAENAATFDQLIETDFFGRLRMFKESISELFFVPLVTAAAIECNIRIGNAYVELINLEKQRLDVASLQSKYAGFNDATVSDATGRTLQLVDLLKDYKKGVDTSENSKEEANLPNDEPIEIGPQHIRNESQTTESEPDRKEDVPASSFIERTVKSLKPDRLWRGARSVNRGFLAGCILLILASFGVYFYANFMIDDRVPSSGVANVELDNSVLREHIRVGKIRGEIFYGQLQTSWDTLTKEKREDYLKKVFLLGAEKGYRQVNLIGKEGKVMGYASPTRLDVYGP